MDDALDQKGLKPCPFCGGTAERVDIEDGDNAGGSFVHCTACDASGNVEFGFKENFISNWNRRAYLSTVIPAEIAGVVERLRQYEGRQWETTACYNGTRDEAASLIQLQAARIAEAWALLDEAVETMCAPAAAYEPLIKKIGAARALIDQPSTDGGKDV